MLKSSRLLAVLMAVCLLLPLTGWAEAAQTTENPKSPEERAAEYLPKLIGSWVGYQGGDTVQFTWYPDGRYEFIFFNRTPTSAVTLSGFLLDLIRTEPADTEVTFEGDLLIRKYSWGTSTLRRMKAPYVRVKAEDETASAPAVQEFVGTFGGRLDGVYVEWTFHGDGRFTQITPSEELEENGFFMAGEKEFAILLGGKLVTYPYRTRPNFIIMYPPQTERFAFARKIGPLEHKPDK